MTIQKAPPEFYYLAEAYFHQDFASLYDDLGELIEDIREGFGGYGSKAILQVFLKQVCSAASDGDLELLWANTNAQVSFPTAAEMRRVLSEIARAL